MTIGRTLAVASGKGGVGKTWFAITLARALTQQGRRVLLVDGDLGLANIDIQLGLTPMVDLSAVVARRVSMQEAVMAYEPGGFDVLAGRSGSGALASLDPSALERVLQGLQSIPGYDHVVLDLGAGLDRVTRRMAAWSDTMLVMATEEPTSLTDAYAVVKLHAADRPGGDSRFVVNQIASVAAGARIFATLARACTVFLGRTPPLAGVIRRDDHVRDAIRRQTLLQTRHPSSPAALDVERIAAALLG